MTGNALIAHAFPASTRGRCAVGPRGGGQTNWKGNPMPKFEIIFAQNVPHYGVVEIQARDRQYAIAKAKQHWRLVQRGQKPWPCTDAEYGNAINSRIVMITDSKGNELVTDIDLDKGGAA